MLIYQGLDRRQTGSNDADGLWSLLSDEVRSDNNLTLEGLRQSFAIAPVKRVEVLGATRSDDQVLYAVKTHFERGDTTIDAVVIERDAGLWRITRLGPGDMQ